MKINSLQISNILSFGYYENIDDAPVIKFNSDLNILVGENGSGKSTVLEVLNFVFKKVLLVSYSLVEERYDLRNQLSIAERKTLIVRNGDSSISGFRLEPNWETETKPQKIKFNISLDEIDKANLKLLQENKDNLARVANLYSSDIYLHFEHAQDTFTIEVSLNKENRSFHINVEPATDPGYLYLTHYNFYKELIRIYNFENPSNQIDGLYESFSLIGGFRNYNSFTPQVSLREAQASQQITNFKQAEHVKSTHQIEHGEPIIFHLVRLRVAGYHFDRFGGYSAEECERLSNDQPFMQLINEKLKLVNLKVKIRLIDKRTWAYSFEFFDLKRNRVLVDINSLSAGQKAIIHLIFEAYGRGNVDGGLIIIDEPEIHLHYQLQHEYLRIIEQLNKEQHCQFILVTHSESLINSETIAKVKRFALDSELKTWVASPIITENQRALIKILDNTRSTYAFFGKKVVLVEGDYDRYFFKAVFQKLNPEFSQEIAILDIGGKGNYQNWKSLFESFGVEVFFIGDFDNVFTLKLSESTLIDKLNRNELEDELKQHKLDNLSALQKEQLKDKYNNLVKDANFLINPKRMNWKSLLDSFVNFAKITNREIADKARSVHTDIDDKIREKYKDKVFILRKGDIEEYIKTSHSDLSELISFCDSDLDKWLFDESEESQEIKFIIGQIAKEGRTV